MTLEELKTAYKVVGELLETKKNTGYYSTLRTMKGVLGTEIADFVVGKSTDRDYEIITD